MSQSKFYRGRIPYRKSDDWFVRIGELADYTGLSESDDTYGRYIWKDNLPFYAELRTVSYFRGRSAAALYLEDAHTKVRYIIRIARLTEMLKDVNMLNGYIAGYWIVEKKGANYGLVYLGEDYSQNENK